MARLPGDMINRIKLGYTSHTLGYRLPEKNRKAGAEVRGKLQQVDILRGSGHEQLALFKQLGRVLCGEAALRTILDRWNYYNILI